MARRKIKEPEELESINMTPMIDVVFQLIIFFMLIMDMSKAQLEPVVLPYASKAEKEKFADESMIVLNVMPDGKIKIQGKLLYDPKRDTADEGPKKLEDIFETRRQQRRFQEIEGRDDYVNYPVLIRADRSTEFQHLQRILMIATKHGGVTRIQLGAKMDK